MQIQKVSEPHLAQSQGPPGPETLMRLVAFFEGTRAAGLKSAGIQSIGGDDIIHVPQKGSTGAPSTDLPASETEGRSARARPRFRHLQMK